MREFFATWGFLIAAALFLIAGTLPLVDGGEMNLTLLILGIAFLVIGIVRAKSERGSA